MLSLPVTLRIPKPNEMPGRPDLEELLIKRKEARIEEGYRIRINNTPQLPFSFYADINIDNRRLWDLFLSLAATLPDSLSCIYGHVSDEPITTMLFPKTEILKILSRYKTELSADCFLSFGLLFLSRTKLQELSVTDCKYIQYNGSNKEEILACLQSFQLRELKGISFVDEYPKVIEPLQKFIRDAVPAEKVIHGLDRAFGIQRNEDHASHR